LIEIEGGKSMKKILVIGIIFLFIVVDVVSSGNNIKDMKKVNIVDNLNLDVKIFYPTDDALIRQNDPDKPQGHNIHISIRNHGGEDWTYQGLIKFNISSIASNSKIIYASLNCYYNYYKDNNPSGNTFNLYRITEDWNEEMVTWNTQPPCDSPPSTFIIMPSSPGVWLKWDVKSDIEDFIDGTHNNYGWKISDDTFWSDVNIPLSRLCSKEYDSYPPYLKIIISKPRCKNCFPLNQPFRSLIFDLSEEFPILHKIFILLR
jgi:hypothetical protein